MTRFSGQSVILTGGAAAWGGLVDCYLREDASVTVPERSPGKCDALRADFGDRVLIVEGDVTLEESNEEIAARAVAAFGQIDACSAPRSRTGARPSVR
jgi:NAD(P)-dependent dehydrogenase (short-subunit alcohol dehydrogenase family)